MNIIDQAAERLRGRWRKGSLGSYWTPDGDVCVIGALLAIYDRETGCITDMPEFLAIADVVPGGVSPDIFNDDPATTEEDVLLLLKHASALYDERAGQTP